MKTIRLRQVSGCIDFAIITIRPDEFEAVLKRFTPHFPVIDGAQIYEYSQIIRPDHYSITVAVVRSYDQGQVPALSVAKDVINDLKPRWLVLAGIAGGVPDNDFTLGDVALANSLHDLSVTAAIEGRPLEFRPGGGPPHVDVERLLGNLPAWRDRLGDWNSETKIGMRRPIPDLRKDRFYGDERIQESVRTSLLKHFPSTGSHRLPLYTIGAGATSNVLLKDTGLLSEWKSVARHLSHVEMEAGGVYTAARQARPKPLPLLCVRGISDIIGFQRGDEWTQFACDVAASFLRALLMSLPLPVFYEPSLLQKLGARLRQLIGSFSWLADRPNWWKRRKSPTIQEIVAAFERTSQILISRAVSPPDRINRPELTDLERLIGDNNSARVHFVLGSPGSGKTALLAHIGQNAAPSGMVVFAIKADVLPRDDPFGGWGRREIGVDISALDAIKVVAIKLRVLVLIDQLDALASTVDLTSDRLNKIVDFVLKCSAISNVLVICSCRNFEFQYDTRFRMLNAGIIELKLPAWKDIAAFLERRGITGTEAWQPQIHEILRTPQHLQLYLSRFKATGKPNPFGSYHLMLDDLWERLIQTDEERHFVEILTQKLIDGEDLWAPLASFERQLTIIKILDAKRILHIEEGRVGFRHQTLLEHSKARLFTKTENSLINFVFDKGRQNSILIRPTILAVLRYLKGAKPLKYRAELEEFFQSPLRLHLRYLLIELVGEFQDPEDFEIALLAEAILNPTDRIRVLIAIRGNPNWFDALCTSHLPTVMQGPSEIQWPMISVIGDAWHFASEKCVHLIESYWLPDRKKDELTWRALQLIPKWNAETTELARKLIRFNRTNEQRNYWAEILVNLISEDLPDLGPKVFLDAVSRIPTVDGSNESEQRSRTRSPIESLEGWYELPGVADAAPLEFLRDGWSWLVQVCEEHHSGYCGSVLYEYAGSCFSLDQINERPQSPILTAFLQSIDHVAKAHPKAFVDITRESWRSENAVVHRLLARGLALVSQSDPEIGLDYLAGDRRRLWLGDFESDHQSDSIALLRATMPGLSTSNRAKLQELVLTWSKYRDETDVCEEQKRWNREQRVPLLESIAEYLSPEVLAFLRDEKAEFPEWNRKRKGVRFGKVYTIPAITKSEMLTATNDEVLNAISNSRQSAGKSVARETDSEWREQGGPHTAGPELSELAKENSPRAFELLVHLLQNRSYEAAAEGIYGLPDTISDEDLFAFVRSIASLDIQSEEVRSNMSSVLYRRCHTPDGLPDDICNILRAWLSMPFDANYSIFAMGNSNTTNDTVTSILWSSSGGIFDSDRSFWPLLAVTHGYLDRSPAETSRWLEVVEEHLNRTVSENTWAGYCMTFQQMRWVKAGKDRGIELVCRLFRQFPHLGFRREGVCLIAQISDLLPQGFLQELLIELRQSSDFLPRQAYGEVLTWIALRDQYDWAKEWLNRELSAKATSVDTDEPILVGIAFAAARLWDEQDVRMEASLLLSRLIPHTTDKIGQAIGTVFWAEHDFAVDDATDNLLRAFSNYPSSLSKIPVLDFVEHLAKLTLHRRELVLNVCRGIAKLGRHEGRLFEIGHLLVEISMTLQRFSETRDGGLSLLEELLQLGLDDAISILRDIDIRPNQASQPPVRRGRRRRRPPHKA
ncbi:MAG: hypothetical protein U0941_01710 [Planctomycetaceae bacterium]